MTKMIMAAAAVLMLAGCTVDPDSCEGVCVNSKAENMAKCVRECGADRRKDAGKAKPAATFRPNDG